MSDLEVIDRLEFRFPPRTAGPPYSEIRMWRDPRENSLTVRYLGGLLDGTEVTIQDWELLQHGFVGRVDADALAADLLKPASEQVIVGQCREVAPERLALPAP